MLEKQRIRLIGFDPDPETIRQMIRTPMLAILLCICILTGIGFARVPFINHYQHGTRLALSEFAVPMVTGFIIITGSVRALISVMRRSRF